MLAALGLTGLLLTFGSAGCGDDGCSNDAECAGDRQCEIATGECLDPGGGGGGDNNGNGGNNSSNNDGNDTTGNDGNGDNGDDWYCCVNDNYYDCPDEDAVESCVFDFDESQCSRDESQDGTCDDNGGNGGNGGNGSTGKEIGELCQEDSECAEDICVWENPGDSYGFCTRFCESWSDCPSFWDCVELGDAPADVCVED